MSVRRVNLFNVVAGLFESRQQVWGKKAIELQKEGQSCSVNFDKCGETQRQNNHLWVEGRVGLIMAT